MGKKDEGFDFHKLSANAQVGIALAIGLTIVGTFAALSRADSSRYDKESNPAYWHYKHHWYQSSECNKACKFMENTPLPEGKTDGPK